ncbi:hypothetical protein M413DRAFT_18729 [Hebeloma cylindrosporum]|uniref:Coenzyme Q-binding protein COQ10 START domain-containing protein n=1 Tax=Hebeloma cylindrosporum TaxID=76867 RepID=A0A0C3CDR9_HEBCY|nr:hypothetical protein M413DRAFT_18729 [Hebeloma cylindrosporum h7]
MCDFGVVMSSRLPPLAAEHIFSVSSSSLIDASRERVWSIMVDFESYKERSMTLVTPSNQPLEDQTPSVGKHISIAVNIPPKLGEPGWFGSGSAFVRIEVFDSQNFRAVWTTAGFPHWLLHSERWQTLTVDETNGKTRYETIEVFDGVVAYAIKFFVGGMLRLGFKAAAESLKARAEQD